MRQSQQKSSAEIFKKPLWQKASMANSVDPDQAVPIGAVCSGSTLFASILNLSVMLGNICSRRLQHPTFSDAFFSWCF